MPELLIENAIGRFIILSEDSGLCWKTLSEGGVWELETINFITANLGGQSIITAGTYVGDFLPGISKFARWVYGFEPDQQSFEICRNNIALNDISNVSCENVAVGSKAGIATLIVSGAQNA